MHFKLQFFVFALLVIAYVHAADVDEANTKKEEVTETSSVEDQVEKVSISEKEGAKKETAKDAVAKEETEADKAAVPTIAALEVVPTPPKTLDLKKPEVGVEAKHIVSDGIHGGDSSDESEKDENPLLEKSEKSEKVEDLTNSI
ncbi:hypothetical protein NECID01_0566 [Nematocida sp. AWRm77]|nr:hypothetical protein NECID01_0566 [Nematocida sp. AWRm77]